MCGHGQPLAPAGVTAQAGTPRRPWAARPGGSGRAGTRRHAAPGSPGAASASSSGAAPAGSPRSPGPFLRPRSRCRAPAPATGPRAPPGPRCTRAHASAVVTIHGVREELEQKGRSCDGRGCGRGPGHAPLRAPDPTLGTGPGAEAPAAQEPQWAGHGRSAGAGETEQGRGLAARGLLRRTGNSRLASPSPELLEGRGVEGVSVLCARNSLGGRGVSANCGLLGQSPGSGGCVWGARTRVC